MITQHSTASFPKKRLPMAVGFLLALGVIIATPVLQAAPGGKGGTVVTEVANAGAAPPVPYVNSIICMLPNETIDITVFGLVTNGEVFVQGSKSNSITGTFNGGGISIRSITVNADNSLTLTIKSSKNAPLTTSNLTITNPGGQSATSTSAVVCVTDTPLINSTAVTPTLASVVDQIEASATEVTSIENTVPVTYEYEWLENENPIAHTGKILPASLTSAGNTYTCNITPLKGTRIRGEKAATPAVNVTADVDSNGIHDQWESVYFDSTGNDPAADADGDGLSNRAEYLFGLDPKDRNSNKPVVSPLNPANGEFEYRRAVNKLSGTNYRVMTSPDLITWTEQTGFTESVNNANSQSEVVNVKFSSTLISSNPKLFVKVTVE